MLRQSYDENKFIFSISAVFDAPPDTSNARATQKLVRLFCFLQKAFLKIL
jgi:hypothetical protein